MNILLCLSHSIEESDQLRLFHSLGHNVASIGGFIDPAHPHDDKRPAMPHIPMVPAVKEAVDALGTPDNLGAAQNYIPDAILDWLGDDGVIFYHHYLDRLFQQWAHIRDWMKGSPRRRVVWRTVGQSVAGNEATAHPFRADGLEIVRYSPKEQNIPGYAGHDALIRFYVDPDEWKGWTGDYAKVIQITQHLRQRDPYTNWGFWEQATKDLPRVPFGPGSEAIGGPGSLPYDNMKLALQAHRAYLYTGTQPASYTLGLLEALATGIPVISIGPAHMRIFPYGPDLFEGHELASGWTDYPETAATQLRLLLDDHEQAKLVSEHQRRRAIEMFGMDRIKAEWTAFLA